MNFKKKLKILMVLQTPWGTDLGMSKVHFELKKAYEALGHQVDYIDEKKLYPKGKSFLSQIFGKSIQLRILDYLKENAKNYDVIDANQRCIPFHKSDYNFKGIVLFRSHGLPPIYTLAENQPYYKRLESTTINIKTRKSFRNILGDIKRFLIRPEGEWVLWSSIKNADIVHCLNLTEYRYLLDYGVSQDKLAYIPNGIDTNYLIQARKLVNQSCLKNKITFLGSWTTRKGIVHLPKILESLPEEYSMQLLGTGNSIDNIKKFFDSSKLNRLEIHTHFSEDQEIELLRQTKLGIFPSYVEGFGLAIVEMLALGIPVIAYNVPGPFEILTEIDSRLLVPVGNEKLFIERISEILSLSSTEFDILSEKCRNRAEFFDYKFISEEFIKKF
ncbi:glycosyltransferase [Acinetobacter soli]|uniref:glycosyltransferase family 4 protein n=1 Tax=Acinetobacter soli TaxID=487316 RepID=UPI0004688AE3|nr:glycosyltransferase [Acinetobacter soli]